MLTAFGPFANATLTVDLAVAPYVQNQETGWITDPDTGNMIPNPVTQVGVAMPITRHVYSAHLHPSSTPQLIREAGVNSSQFILEGQLLDPWQFDELVAPNQIFDATYNGMNGKYELLPDRTMLPEFKSILGTRLYGIFRMSGAGQTI